MKHEFFTQGPLQRRTEILAALAFLLGCFWLNTACAKEVYTWTDKNGVSHFSDVPPESGDSQQISIEDTRSSGTNGDSPVEVAPVPGDSPASDTPQSYAETLRDQLAEDRKKRNEAQAETDALCTKNRQLVEKMEPARRVFYTDEQGEQVRLDDEERVAMVEEAKDFMAKNCR